MNPTTHDPIKAISRAVSIVDDFSFIVFDQQIHVAYQQPYQKWDKPLDHFGQNTGEEKQLKVNLSSQLSSVIYSAFYVTGEVNEAGLNYWKGGHYSPKTDASKKFIEDLSKHNRTPEGSHKFWRVYALDQQGNAFVEKNGEVRQLLPNSYEYVKEGETQLQTNSMVHIKRPKEHRDLQPTFYHLNSEELMPLGEEIGRFYWNIEPEGAKYLVEHVSEIFNRYKVPFMFKCTNHPDLYSRTDGAVLYILRKQYRIASRLVRMVVQKMKPYLKTEVPLFTRKLTNGLSYAEDPGMNQSFGMSRSELIAKGIVNAYSQRRNNKTAQYKEILKAFKENGLDYKQPYLRANSHWSYDFDFLK
ncbi:MAG: T3SS effector HopA1 family protein [Saprospiraceae bacterium]|nr:T3SS effector HopA1 family protein [Saprospiraceae bacterium]